MAEDITTATESTTATPRGHRKERVGKVMSNRMNKTIVVSVERRYPHPKFKKVITHYAKFYAHDEKQEAQIGDRVRIQETRPVSKTKRWRLIEVLERNADNLAAASAS